MSDAAPSGEVAPAADAAATGAARRSPWGLLFHRLLEHRAAGISLLFLLLLALVVILVPLVSPYAYDQQDLELIGQPLRPDRLHWFGTDELGQDSLTRVFFGGRISLAVGLASALVATLVGTAIGAAAGFFGGIVDALLMRLTDVVLSIPLLPLVLLLSALLRPGLPMLGAHHRGPHLDGDGTRGPQPVSHPCANSSSSPRRARWARATAG